MKVRLIAIVIVLIGAYIATISLYAGTGLGEPSRLVQGTATSDGTTVHADLDEVHSARGELVINVTVVPGAKLVDPMTHGLIDDLSMTVDSGITPTIRTWTKGSTPGVIPVTLAMTGDPGTYPFDHYRAGPLTIEVTAGNSHAVTRVSPSIFDRTPGWQFRAQPIGQGTASGAYQLDIQRSPSTAAVVAILLAALVTIAVLGITVSVQTIRDRRKFQPPMTTWFAAMLFAVVPLRNALPDAPTIGTWIDVTVILWVIVALVASMALYIACWWRHLNPAFDKL
ncbi:membrane protein [Mycolicibacterium aromaticivorans JS19b1 = JCM 16368]|uniref:Membrane protein n=1 Tax=Mycolicibacterium aromaticivorans JS19b1 = JCM 16368 TaxID=1440774 RepID=A0A064CK91_9MYCO|nr:DUF4436 domain-containing protein [Mycolicibacterium aromaticivorans]KDE99207.1 membrane protein [Mycolicibacterium aromaticivorans JS19b1 = JCM 16368]